MIDGANRWHLFWNITIPLIWDTLRTAVIFIMIFATNMFAITQTMTEGGPSRSSEVLSTLLYQRGVPEQQVRLRHGHRRHPVPDRAVHFCGVGSG